LESLLGLRLVLCTIDLAVKIELVGGTVKLKYRTIEQLVMDLREQYVTRSLVIKEMRKSAVFKLHFPGNPVAIGFLSLWGILPL
jgi:hypothetical protein